ncbi:MAG: anthranilate synthase component I [Candidatus Omnitrophica bacterium]|nr:anthranilate synthase component I [Candidatus Omnitrophota bacterium]
MIQPNFETFRKLVKKGNLIAIMKSIPADLETPVSSFLKLAQRTPYAFLLESAEQEERIGRYSFIGLEPEAIYTTANDKVHIKTRHRTTLSKQGVHLVDCIEKHLSEFKLANPGSLPSFCGGFVGYLGYENVQDFESVKLRAKQGPDIPKGIFFLTQDLLIFDHYRKTLSIVALVKIDRKGSLESLYHRAIKKITRYERSLRRPLQYVRTPRGIKSPLKVKSNMSRQDFQAKVKKIQQYIRAGDCIQVVLSQRFTLPEVREDFQIYRALRSINPSPYMFYFRAKQLRLIGSSPELLVKKTGRLAEVRPIAGTRPRGDSLVEDSAYEDSLKRSSKEMAEHLMLVDLGRNDLGRVSEFDSVRVKNFARVERYSHVMHLVSDVVGRLRPGKTAFDLLKATFPAGTVTGAPKIRAMQIIDELEPETRGPYAGCVGYFSFNHDMDMCITIRTLVVAGRKIYIQAGAGIVKDSNPNREYQETVNKASALMRAVQDRETF